MRKILNALITALLLCLVATSQAQTRENKRLLDKSQAAQKAQQRYNGRVLKVDQQKDKYRVKVLQKSGRVVSVDVDKKSGFVSKKTKGK